MAGIICITFLEQNMARRNMIIVFLLLLYYKYFPNSLWFHSLCQSVTECCMILWLHQKHHHKQLSDIILIALSDENNQLNDQNVASWPMGGHKDRFAFTVPTFFIIILYFHIKTIMNIYSMLVNYVLRNHCIALN